MDIDKMEAGIVLDELIWEHVFKRSKIYSIEATQNCPQYSRDISAAWEVVEKLKLSLIPVNTGWIVSPHHLFEGLFAEAPTAPLAVCRAALKMYEYTKI
jgi:hypothetical protein